MKEKAISTDWFNIILDHSPEAIMALKAVRDGNGNITDLEFLFSNKKALLTIGKPDLAGKFFTKEFPGIKKTGLFDLYVTVIETGDSWSGEVHYDEDGFNQWAYLSVAKLDDGCIVNFTDITDRKRAEQKARQQSYFIEQLMAMSPDIITVLELPSLKMIYSNEQNLATHGFDRDEMNKMSHEERKAMIHPDDAGRLEAFFATFRNNMIGDDEIISCEYRARNKAGEWLWFWARSKVFERNTDHSVRSIVNVIQNITVRKNHELQIKEAKDLLEGITEIIPDMISVQTWPGRETIFYNRHPDEEKLSPVHPDDQDEVKGYWESFSSLPDNGITHVEYRANFKSRGWVWLRARGKVFERDEKGMVKTILNVVQDITNRKYAELKVEQLNKVLLLNNKALESANSEIKMFSNIAANDYSDTLRHLYTNLEHIVSQDARRLSDSGRANLRRAQSSIQKMRLLTDDLMALTKLRETEEKRQDVDIRAVLQSTLGEFSEPLEIFQLDVQCGHMTVSGYPSLVRLLIHHLVDNAIKFRREDGPNMIQIGCTHYVKGDSMKELPAQGNLQYHVWEIVDNGIGFPEDQAARIFEIFHRTNEKRYRGSGIGLAICRKVMDLHGGFIVAAGEPGKGASFRVYFPVA